MYYMNSKKKALLERAVKHDFQESISIGFADIEDKKNIALELLASGENYKLFDKDYNVFYATLNGNDEEKANLIVEALNGKNSKHVKYVYIKKADHDCQSIINKLNDAGFYEITTYNDKELKKKSIYITEKETSSIIYSKHKNLIKSLDEKELEYKSAFETLKYLCDKVFEYYYADDFKKELERVENE